MPPINPSIIYEIIGFLASAIVLVSFLMKDVRAIRFVNVFGAAFFVVYGVLTKTWATAVMNLALIVIHSCFLIRMRKQGADRDNHD